MGNSPVTIGVRAEKSLYEAGEVLRGKVYLSVRGQASPARSILLQIRGREHSVVHHTSSETERDGRREHTYTRDHYDEASHEFFYTEYPLHTYQGVQVQPGQYEYPFTIQLPKGLPSSMQCNRGQSHCCVEYFVSATLVRPPMGMFAKDPRDEQRLTLRATPPLEELVGGSSLQLPNDEVPVQSCCCHHKGTMELEAQFDKTIVQPKDTLQVQFRGRNHSRVKVKKVRVQLEEIVEWSANYGNRETSKRVLFRQDMDARQFPELDKVRRRHQYHDHWRQGNESSYQGGGAYYNDLPGAPADHPQGLEWKGATLRVPLDAYDSYQGRSVQVRHLASVQLLTKGCCTTNPDATTLVQIFRSIPNVATGSSSTPSAPSSLYDESTGVSVTPSAPPSDWDVATPSAPSELYDSSNNDGLPMAQAQLLPPDWHAQTADLVEIPMAQATVLDTLPTEASVSDAPAAK